MFRDAQRQMLDQLSIGVAQFDAQRQMSFANQPFRRILLSPRQRCRRIHLFERFLSRRENGRIPEVRISSPRRREHVDWFTAGALQEEAWLLSDGTHIRVVGSPMPDGGLVLIAEDRTEQSCSVGRHRANIAAQHGLRLSTACSNRSRCLRLMARCSSEQAFAPAWGSSQTARQTPFGRQAAEAIAANLAKPSQVKAIGEVIRSATPDRKQKSGRGHHEGWSHTEFAGSRCQTAMDC
ncbi:MAG: PAS-domain containing protein [Sphingomonadaceae bacterium]|nr:PAS-domain containing protein [Sphingomonadaceae bacterium]